MEEVMKQAPEHISKEDIEIIFKKNNENVIDTLIDLWELDVPKTDAELNGEGEGEGDKWANIRDVCDSFDLEMQTQINRMKNQKQ